MLPKYFCDNCIHILHVAYDFKEKCEYSQNKFLTLLQYKTEVTNSNDASTNPSIPKEMQSSSLHDIDIEFIDENLKFEIESESIYEETNCEILKTDAEYCTDNDEEQSYEDDVDNKSEIEKEIVTANQTETLNIEILGCHDSSTEDYGLESMQDNVTVPKQSNIQKNSKIKHKSNGINEIKCESCDLSFVTRKELSAHRNTPHTCHICNEVLKHTTSLYRHHRRVHLNVKPQNIPANCNICEKTFSLYPNMIRHRESVHEGKRNFTCDICKKTFSRYINLKNHMYSHMKEKQFECDICFKKLINDIQLKLHKKGQHMRPDDENFKVYNYRKMCDLCGKVLKSSSNFTYHMKRHRNEKQFKCNDCNKAFFCKNDLNRHNVTHSNIKAFPCTLCDAKFAHNSGLYAHRLVHMTERPHKCKLCDASFRQKPHLQAHMRKHTGEKPYECQHCGKQFVNTTSYKMHVRLHTGEIVYNCAKCAKKFINSKLLQKHLTLCN